MKVGTTTASAMIQGLTSPGPVVAIGDEAADSVTLTAWFAPGKGRDSLGPVPERDSLGPLPEEIYPRLGPLAEFSDRPTVRPRGQRKEAACQDRNSLYRCAPVTAA